MNILFLSLLSFDSINIRSIYTDLLREFVNHGHTVYAISPTERKEGQETHLIQNERVTILRLRIGNTQKTNIIEKGISTLMIGPSFKKAIKHYFSTVRFDLILYSTPPITFVNAIEYVKKRDGAKTYLLLKDIFPQNAVDIGMMSIGGLKGVLYRHFRRKEKKLYALSDRIGCMSPANVEYVISHNPYIPLDKVEVCPNSIEPIDKSVDNEERKRILGRYNIPLDKTIFVYGGNLGKPQGIPFLIECMKKCCNVEDAFFLLVGDGTEYSLLEEYVNTARQKNIRLMQRLPKEDYDTLVGACDVGMIFLNHSFTIPNFPSRMLSYMQAKLPILAVTDPNTDVGAIITQGDFGWWCESNNSDRVREYIIMISKEEIHKKGNNGYEYLLTHYSANETYNIIHERIDKLYESV